jgi:hypothetical protein
MRPVGRKSNPPWSPGARQVCFPTFVPRTYLNTLPKLFVFVVVVRVDEIKVESADV